MNLWEELGGVIQEPLDGNPNTVSVLAKVVDSCGTQIARVVQAPTFPMVVTTPHLLTKRHTVAILHDRLLLDAETILEETNGAGDDRTRLILDLFEALKADPSAAPRLEVPPTYGDVSMLRQAISVEAETAMARGFKARPVDLDAGCRKCGRWYSLAPELATWWATTGRRPAVIVAQNRTDLSRDRVWSFPDSATPQRVLLYARLRTLYIQDTA